MEIVETIVEPIIEEKGWRLNFGVKICIGIGILIIAAFLVCVMLFFLSRMTTSDLGVFAFVCGVAMAMLFLIGGCVGSGDYQIGENVYYRVRLDDTYPANELIEKYDIVDYKDGIWTITEKGEQP